MQSMQLKQNVSRGYEFRLTITTRGVCRKRIVARHVRMNNVDPLPPHEAIQLMRALHVQRIS